MLWTRIRVSNIPLLWSGENSVNPVDYERLASPELKRLVAVKAKLWPGLAIVHSVTLSKRLQNSGSDTATEFRAPSI